MFVDARTAPSGALTRLLKTTENDTYIVRVDHEGLSQEQMSALLQFRKDNAGSIIAMNGRDGHEYWCRFADQYSVKSVTHGSGKRFNLSVKLHGIRV